MKNILEELWYGNIIPMEHSIGGNAHIKKLINLMGKNRDILSETLNDSQKELLAKYDDAVNALHKAGVHIITHMILGLPGENQLMMQETAKYIGEAGSHGVKLQLLHILKDTDLEVFYNDGNFNALTKKEYIDALCKCVLCLPENTVLHRITGDAPKQLLIAPKWSADKKRVLQEIRDEFSRRNILLI